MTTRTTTNAKSQWIRRFSIALGTIVVFAAVLFLWSFFSLRCRFPIDKSAETQARTIRAAVQNWQSATDSVACPTLEQLIAEKHLDPDSSRGDPWGHPYRIKCTPEEIFVSSPGEDGAEGTRDDVRVPRVVE